MQFAANELELSGRETDCSYLPGRRSRMEYRLALSLSAARYEHLLERGWRRFGRTMFRPVCAACSECRSLRVDIPGFRATKSQRRVDRRNAGIELIIQPPTVTREHLQLYNDYHNDMHDRRGWPRREITEAEYFESFLDGDFKFSREFQYRRDGQLVALGIVDMAGHAMSSIYFVHTPELRPESPGTMSVLRELRAGMQTGHRWLYMGYYIRDCGSMNYKNRFGPHEILRNYVADDVPAEWDPPHAVDQD